VQAVILRYLDQVARVRSIRRAAEICPPSAVWMCPTKRCGDGYRSSGRMFSARTALRPRLDPWVGATYPSQELPKKTLAGAAARGLAADRQGTVANTDPKSLGDLIRLVRNGCDGERCPYVPTGLHEDH
jgi:hypothetical protein